MSLAVLSLVFSVSRLLALCDMGFCFGQNFVILQINYLIYSNQAFK